ncbi:thiamine-phosphate kinase [Pelagicoccus enzymogenes]|uniref:thiamine-phosphate kinase n=1 Tax=Pelagicoccus enzymogenes TaxID=2773457 RepID=UPI00280F100C|nr:thiamine-phosphate kinase [Pelagicoccus enzymogenes]MDQ8200434.1 thiamine-phosphate kinase [Pelagicoccus enzymogenes]
MNPYTEDQSQSIGSLGESKLIEQLKDWLGDAAPAAPFGMGDDCAVLPSPSPGAQQLVTADPIIYGKHFDAQVSPAQAAAKLMRRNLSDIAAMGGRPIHAVISLALDPKVSISWIEPFYKALAEEAKRFQCVIVGGDVSSADHFLGAFLTLYGETSAPHPPLLRHSAQVGSPIFVTGSLGGTRLKKHHSFIPRISEGQWLARSEHCLSCSDLSDGLGKDFANVLPPALGCEIDCSQLPIADDAIETAKSSGKDALYHVFNDGEDFELIFALKPGTAVDSFLTQWRKELQTPVTKIGYATSRTVSKAPRLSFKNAPQSLSANGYEHLR